MRRFFTLFRREVSHYFHQPLAYVVLCLFSLVTGLEFQFWVNTLNGQGGRTTILEAFFNSYLIWIPFVLIFPLLTMRLFSEEYKLGTIEALMTAPVRDGHVVLAKFLGALVFYAFLWLPSALYFLIFRWQTGLSAAGTAGSFLGAYVMLLLVGMFYLSIGCLTSSLTSNQIVAAVMCFAVISIMFFFSLISFLFPAVSPLLQEFTYYLSTVEHMGEFSRGLFDTRPMVFYLSLTAFTLFLTYHIFQYRRWKS